MCGGAPCACLTGHANCTLSPYYSPPLVCVCKGKQQPTEGEGKRGHAVEGWQDCMPCDSGSQLRLFFTLCFTGLLDTSWTWRSYATRHDGTVVMEEQVMALVNGMCLSFPRLRQTIIHCQILYLCQILQGIRSVLFPQKCVHVDGIDQRNQVIWIFELVGFEQVM